MSFGMSSSASDCKARFPSGHHRNEHLERTFIESRLQTTLLHGKLLLQIMNERERLGSTIEMIERLEKVFNVRTLTIFSWSLLLLLLLLLLFVPVNVILWCCIEDIEITISCIANFQDTGQISTAIAVVRSTPHGAQSVIIQNLVPFLTKLMRSQDMGHAVDLKKFLDHISSKSIPSAPRRQGEFVPFWIRV